MTTADRKSVLITGAARRLGRAFAAALAADGWHVHLHHNASEDAAADLAQGLPAATTHRTDLADPAACADLIEACFAAGPAPTALINNASTFAHDLPDTLTAEGFDKAMAVNLRAPLLLAKDFAARCDGPGQIVNILDTKVFNLNPDFFSYTLAKHGLWGATEMLAMRFAPHIRVNAVAPGLTLISGKQTPESFARAQSFNPLGLGPTPDELIAALRLILTSPAMTGEVITLDGGQRLRRQSREVAYLTPEERDG